MGNPGPEYAGTRHNAGFQLADFLARRWNLPGFRRAGPVRATSGMRAGDEIRILKPLTYMNRSGAVLGPLRDAPDFNPAENLLVLVDDVALDIGRFRLRAVGSAGGHNGLKSIEGALRRQDYPRLRIGIGPVPPDVEDLADFVLDEFRQDEQDQLEALMEPMAQAVERWVEQGIEKAMNEYNR
ncbi:MAG: aminoacyl-tRNA hydrolase [Gemmatimonadales bacterium]